MTSALTTLGYDMPQQISLNALNGYSDPDTSYLRPDTMNKHRYASQHGRRRRSLVTELPEDIQLRLMWITVKRCGFDTLKKLAFVFPSIGDKVLLITDSTVGIRWRSSHGDITVFANDQVVQINDYGMLSQSETAKRPFKLFFLRGFESKDNTRLLNDSSVCLYARYLTPHSHVLLATANPYWLRLMRKHCIAANAAIPAITHKDNQAFVLSKHLTLRATPGNAMLNVTDDQLVGMESLNAIDFNGISRIRNTIEASWLSKVNVYLGPCNVPSADSPCVPGPVSFAAPLLRTLRITFHGSWAPDILLRPSILWTRRLHAWKPVHTDLTVTNANWSYDNPYGKVCRHQHTAYTTQSQVNVHSSFHFQHHELVKFKFVYLQGVVDAYLPLINWGEARCLYWKRLCSKYDNQRLLGKVKPVYVTDCGKLERLSIFSVLKEDPMLEDRLPTFMNSSRLQEVTLVALEGSDKSWNTRELFSGGELELVKKLRVVSLDSSNAPVMLESDTLSCLNPGMKELTVWGYTPSFITQWTKPSRPFAVLTTLTVDLSCLPITAKRSVCFYEEPIKKAAGRRRDRLRNFFKFSKQPKMTNMMTTQVMEIHISSTHFPQLRSFTLASSSSRVGLFGSGVVLELQLPCRCYELVIQDIIPIQALIVNYRICQLFARHLPVFKTGHSSWTLGNVSRWEIPTKFLPTTKVVKEMTYEQQFDEYKPYEWTELRDPRFK